MADGEQEKKGSLGCGLAVLAVLAVGLVVGYVLLFGSSADPKGDSIELCRRGASLRLESQGRRGEPRFTDEAVTEPEPDRFVVTGSVDAGTTSRFTCTVRRSGDNLRMVDLDLPKP